MGAKSSTPRTVHLENDTPIGVIDVSDDVVQRLKGMNAQARQEEKERKRDDIETVAIPAIPTTPLSPSPAQPAGAVYYGNIALGADQTVTALEVRRLKEQELRNNDLYWQRRLQQQEQQLKQTNAILEKEYNETFNEVRKRFENSPSQHQLPPCKEFKAKLIECYKANSNQPLNCASVVNEFSSCIQTHRTSLLSEKQKLHVAKPVAIVAAAS